MESSHHTCKAGPAIPQTNHISVLAEKSSMPSTPSTSGIASPPAHYTGSINYTDTEWREVQAWGSVKETKEIHKVYDEQGRKIINKYEVLKEIGRGVHGKVKLARTSDSNEMVALKILPRKTKARLGRPETNTHEQTVRREIAILKKCVHPHVVRLREVIDDPASDKIYLVLEYMWGGEVIWRTEDEEPALKLHQARSTFRDTMLGLEFLHYQGIIHRDIKPANLLWTKNHSVKISDFGVSHTSTSNSDVPSTALELAKTAGTPAFFAPELCWTTEMEERPPITKAIDIWALGVTLYCLLCGRVPFEAMNEFELFDKITHDTVEIPEHLDDEARDLLKRMLIKNPADRITIPEIKRHPFVLKGVRDPEQWISDTNPGLFGQLEVNDQEVHEAVSSYESFKRRLTKIGSRLAGGLRRRTISMEDKTPRALTRRRDQNNNNHNFSESSSKSSSWMNFMRTNESADGGAASSATSKEVTPSSAKDRDRAFYVSRIASEEHLHPGARPIVMRRASPREADNLTRSESPSFAKQPVNLHASRNGLQVSSDIPQSQLTRSIGFHHGLIAEESGSDGGVAGTNSDRHRLTLPSLSFESRSGSRSSNNDDDDDDDDNDDDDGCFIDFNRRRSPSSRI